MREYTYPFVPEETYCKHCDMPMRFHRLGIVRVRCSSPGGFGEEDDAETRQLREDLAALEKNS